MENRESGNFSLRIFSLFLISSINIIADHSFSSWRLFALIEHAESVPIQYFTQKDDNNDVRRNISQTLEIPRWMKIRMGRKTSIFVDAATARKAIKPIKKQAISPSPYLYNVIIFIIEWHFRSNFHSHVLRLEETKVAKWHEMRSYQPNSMYDFGS